MDVSVMELLVDDLDDADDRELECWEQLAAIQRD
jgi:hypothetical protein